MFERIAKIIFKSFIYMAILSTAISFTNIIPVYLNLRSAANSILISTTLNNYITRDNLTQTIDSYFNDSNYVGAIICKDGEQECKSNPGNLGYTWNNSGIYAYVSVGNNPVNHDIGTKESGHGNTGRKALVDEGSTFDPKLNPDDAFKLDDHYKGANRGTRITVRLDTMVRLQIYVFGTYYSAGFPISTGELSAPAMYYYRNMEP